MKGSSDVIWLAKANLSNKVAVFLNLYLQNTVITSEQQPYKVSS